jgi:hypothetical protein
MSEPDFAAMPVTKGGLCAYLEVDGALKAAAFYERRSPPSRPSPFRRTRRAAPCMSISTSTARR